jgi:hypothetical protein
MRTLAQQLAQGSRSQTDALLWIGVILFATIAGGFVVLMMRRRLLAPRDSAADHAGIMDSLRAMRDRGELSQAEFEAARRSMIEKAMSRKPQATPGKGPPPQSGSGQSPDLNR